MADHGTAPRPPPCALVRVAQPVASAALRRTGLRAAATGDRGVTCDACHEGLAGHLARPATARPTTLDDAGCRACHTTEQSPRYEPAAYRHRVEDAGRALE